MSALHNSYAAVVWDAFVLGAFFVCTIMAPNNSYDLRLRQDPDNRQTNQGFWQSMKTLIDLAWSAMSAGCSNWDASADSYLMLLV
jgi:hypothetical protein